MHKRFTNNFRVFDRYSSRVMHKRFTNNFRVFDRYNSSSRVMVATRTLTFLEEEEEEEPYL